MSFQWLDRIFLLINQGGKLSFCLFIQVIQLEVIGFLSLVLGHYLALFFRNFSILSSNIDQIMFDKVKEICFILLSEGIGLRKMNGIF